MRSTAAGAGETHVAAILQIGSEFHKDNMKAWRNVASRKRRKRTLSLSLSVVKGHMLTFSGK